MAEIYHDTVLDHLRELQRSVNDAINSVIELERNGHKYKAAEKALVVANVKALDQDVHNNQSGSVVDYQGNSSPT